MSSEGGHVSYLYERSQKQLRRKLVFADYILKNINSGRIGILADNQDALRNVKNTGYYLGFRKSARCFKLGWLWTGILLNDQYVRHIESLTSYNEVLAALRQRCGYGHAAVGWLMPRWLRRQQVFCAWWVIRLRTKNIDELAMAVGLSSRYLAASLSRSGSASANLNAWFRSIMQLRIWSVPICQWLNSLNAMIFWSGPFLTRFMP